MAGAMMLRMVAPTRGFQGKPGDMQHGCRREPGRVAEARGLLPTACLPVLTVDVADPMAPGHGDRVTGTQATEGERVECSAALSFAPCPAAVRSSRGGS